ncbi:MAG: sensor histidine kinase, partial [Campylobacteraceae bacterium]|nr:sensor histidine kinase [Campylobacteraceae bacterium]
HDFFDEIAKSNSLNYKILVENDIYIRFNQTSLERLIDNNISNAIKYSFTNSAIQINLAYIDDNNILFEVITSSKQIEAENKIFNDFYRENSNRGGFGLGLKIVKEICDKNNVIIKLDSNTKETKFAYRFKIDENITT